MTPEIHGLAQEWVTLQNNFELYEKGGLLIKLFAILLCALGFALALHELVMALLLLVLWLQEGIYRTFQARLGVRIARLEAALKNPDASFLAAYQLHSEWLTERPGTSDLLAEYGASALRPTVAFPYAALLLLLFLLMLLAGH